MSEELTLTLSPDLNPSPAVPAVPDQAELEKQLAEYHAIPEAFRKKQSILAAELERLAVQLELAVELELAVQLEPAELLERMAVQGPPACRGNSDA